MNIVVSFSWVVENLRWLFGGIGGGILVALVSFLIRRLRQGRTDRNKPPPPDMQPEEADGRALDRYAERVLVCLAGKRYSEADFIAYTTGIHPQRVDFYLEQLRDRSYITVSPGRRWGELATLGRNYLVRNNLI